MPSSLPTWNSPCLRTAGSSGFGLTGRMSRNAEGRTDGSLAPAGQSGPAVQDRGSRLRDERPDRQARRRAEARAAADRHALPLVPLGAGHPTVLAGQVVRARPASQRSWSCSDLALWFPGGSGAAGPAGNQARARPPTKHFAGSTKPWPARRPRSITFAAWFIRWDSGTTPLIIDRLALSAAGHGPRSRCTPNRVGPRGQPLSLRTLQQYGLTLLRLDSALVITSQGEAARSDQTDNWLRAIGEALLWGSDRSDRFQTAARWRGEITPRDAPVGGSAEPLRALPGWSTWRFTGASWPGEAGRVELRDGSARASSRAGRWRFWSSSV